MYIDNQEISQHMAQETKEKWEKIANGDEPYPCSVCGIAKHPKDFVIQWLDNHWVGKYRYLYECKECKKARIYKKRDQVRESLDGALNVVYKQIKQGAKPRNVDFSLSLEDILGLWDKQKGLCYYTGLPMSYQGVALKAGKQSEKTKNQVSCDRLDPNRGYEQGNVVLCCTIVNKMKNILTVEEFLKTCKDIVNYKKR